MADDKIYDQREALHGLRHSVRLPRTERDVQTKSREVGRMLTTAYHLMKGTAELATMIAVRIEHLPEDERDRAQQAVGHIMHAYGILDTLVADSGNDTPHEKASCQRCGSALKPDGRCSDLTCPFSDCQQSDPTVWAGHPDHEKG